LSSMFPSTEFAVKPAGRSKTGSVLMGRYTVSRVAPAAAGFQSRKSSILAAFLVALIAGEEEKHASHGWRNTPDGGSSGSRTQRHPERSWMAHRWLE
jgi:hypothetical protein